MREVWAGDWRPGLSSAGVVRIAQESLAPAVDRPIVIHLAEGRRRPLPPAESDEFPIYIWSTLEGNDKPHQSVPRELWGIDVDFQGRGFYPSGQGRAIVDLNARYAAAELFTLRDAVSDRAEQIWVAQGKPEGRAAEHWCRAEAEVMPGRKLQGSGPRCLFVHHDLVRSGSGRERLIFQRICEEAAKELMSDPADLARERWAQARDGFLSTCLRELTEEIEDAQRVAASDVRTLQQRLLRAVRDAERARHRVRELQSGQLEQQQLFEREFAQLQRLEHIRGVIAHDQYVTLLTVPIYCRDPETDLFHRLGRYAIQFDLETGEVKFTNLDGVVEHDGYDHHAPHVDSDGDPCLGNVSALLPELLGSYRIVDAATVAVSYLQGIDPDDCEAPITCWPVAPGYREEGVW